MKPPDDLKQWSKNDLVREVRRLRAITREMSERVGDDPRGASTDAPIIGGSPTGRGDALIDARAAVLLEDIEVVLIDRKLETDPLAMMLTLGGRINYADDVVTHAYLFGPDGAAGLVSELISLAGRAGGMRDDPGGQAFARAFKTDLERRMSE